MTHLSAIWSCMKLRMTKGQWVSLEDIYSMIQLHIDLDAEDFEPQSPTSDIPKWKRNVRNVLQYRKNTGEVEWDGSGSYKL